LQAECFNDSGIRFDSRPKHPQLLIPTVVANVGMKPAIGMLVNPTPVDAGRQGMKKLLSADRPGSHQISNAWSLEP